MVQSVFTSNALVSKMVQKRMQGQAGLGTKMILPRKRLQVSLLPSHAPVLPCCACPSPSMDGTARLLQPCHKQSFLLSGFVFVHKHAHVVTPYILDC